jgi:hypothetical protein
LMTAQRAFGLAKIWQNLVVICGLRLRHNANYLNPLFNRPLTL